VICVLLILFLSCCLLGGGSGRQHDGVDGVFRNAGCVVA